MDVLSSIGPEWCELIANGKKTIEVRKTKPKIETPFKSHIYCTGTKPYLVWGDVFRGSWETELTTISGYSRKKAEEIWEVFNGKVIGEFICREITDFEGEFWVDETYERIQKIVKDHEHYAEYGEYEYETVATNEDENYKENWLCKQSCVSWEGLRKYIGAGINEFCGWHISEPVIYDVPKDLSAFCVIDRQSIKRCKYRERVYNNPDYTNGALLRGGYTCNRMEDWCKNCITKPLTRPPQSWCYVEEA